MRYNPSAGLLLTFVGDQVYLVLIEGSNLNALVKNAVSLYDRGIQRHRVTWVREMTRQQATKAGQGEVTVERIRTLSYLWVSKTSSAGRINTTRAGCDGQERAYATRV
jgi:hypothetical protein